jgi:endonuclease III
MARVGSKSGARGGRAGDRGAVRAAARPQGGAGAAPKRGSAATAERRAHAREVARRLAAAIPQPRCELRHDGAWQLLVATILSAQCTDERVNAVTRELFRRWPSAAALGDAALTEVEAVIRPTGFYRNKARAIVAASRRLADDWAGVVPRTMEDLVTLPGVARKTANVVLGTAYGLASGIVVDTHVGRVARRLALTTSDDPVAVEGELCGLFPRAAWVAVGHRLLLHGRYVCVARVPRCAACPLGEVCPSGTETPRGAWRARAAAERAVVERAVEG